MSKPREFEISKDSYGKVCVNGPDFEVTDVIVVIEKSYADKLEAENNRLAKELINFGVEHPCYRLSKELEAKLKLAVEALESICSKKCAYQNPCEAREALNKIATDQKAGSE